MTTPTTPPVRIVAVNAGLGEPSSTRLLIDRLVDATRADLLAAGVAVDDVAVEIINLRDLAAEIGASLAGGFPTGTVRTAMAAVENADGVIAATPVFNASYSGLFKSFFDLVDVEAFGAKPVLIGATGGSPRHSMVLDHAMRPLFSYLRAIVVPTGVYAAAEDWAGTTGDTATLGDRVARAAGEFVTLIAPRVGRVNGIGTDSRTTGFDDDPPASRTGTQARQERAELAGIANFAKLLGGK